MWKKIEHYSEGTSKEKHGGFLVKSTKDPTMTLTYLCSCFDVLPIRILSKAFHQSYTYVYVTQKGGTALTKYDRLSFLKKGSGSY